MREDFQIAKEVSAALDAICQRVSRFKAVVSDGVAVGPLACHLETMFRRADHPDLPQHSWQFAVGNGETLPGYWEWSATVLICLARAAGYDVHQGQGDDELFAGRYW